MNRLRKFRVVLLAAWFMAAWFLAATSGSKAQPRQAYGAIDRMPPALEGEAAWLFDAPAVEGVRLAQNTEAIGRPVTATATDLPRGGRPERKALQSIDFRADWAPQFGEDSLGRSTFSTGVGIGVPPTLLGVPLLISPRGGIHLVDGPAGIDAPPRLYDLEVGVGTFKQLGPRWSVRGSVTTGIYSDDDSFGDSDALRVSGFGIAIWEAAPGWQWVFGAAYLNRDDIAVVPAVGVIHDRGDLRYELTMPRPRIIRRLPQSARGRERSLYLAGELGGGAWAVQRANGTTDTLNISRWGILAGYEVGGTPDAHPLAPGSWSRRYELGYLFGREVEFAESGEQFPLDDSLIARIGFTY